MRVLKIDRRRVSVRVLRQAADVIAAGGVVVFPTETAYGLAADPANAAAVRKIFAIKGRRADKQLPLIAGSLAQAKSFVSLSGMSLKLAKKYWPGPLSIISRLRPGKKIAGIRGSVPTVALRVPALSWARSLADDFGAPITSTSANLSGQQAVYGSAGIRRSFSGRRHQPDLFLDAGSLPTRKPSTIIKIEDGRIKVLRPGPITFSVS